MLFWPSQVALENLPANTGDVRDSVSTPGLGRCPGGGHGNLLQCSCLEDATDREAWQVTATGSQSWTCHWGFPGGAAVKNLPANAEDTRDVGSIPGSECSPGGGNGNPLQYSCLENFMDKGAWQATVHGVAKSQTQLITHAHTTRVNRFTKYGFGNIQATINAWNSCHLGAGTAPTN